jgi:hypothetical protein
MSQISMGRFMSSGIFRIGWTSFLLSFALCHFGSISDSILDALGSECHLVCDLASYQSLVSHYEMTFVFRTQTEPVT